MSPADFYVSPPVLPFLLSLLHRLIETAQLDISDTELNLKSKQYDSIIDDVIKSAVPKSKLTPVATVTTAATEDGMIASSEPSNSLLLLFVLTFICSMILLKIVEEIFTDIYYVFASSVSCVYFLHDLEICYAILKPV